jgi:hypothetical protein
MADDRIARSSPQKSSEVLTLAQLVGRVTQIQPIADGSLSTAHTGSSIFTLSTCILLGGRLANAT